MWYTKDGVDKVGTASIYTVNKFDGLVLVVDTHGGKGGTIRGFLNDGSLDYSSHHGVDGLAFGHCDYPYRNLERTSVVKVRHMKDNFEVIVDDKLCFGSNKVSFTVPSIMTKLTNVDHAPTRLQLRHQRRLSRHPRLL